MLFSRLYGRSREGDGCLMRGLFWLFFRLLARKEVILKYPSPRRLRSTTKADCSEDLIHPFIRCCPSSRVRRCAFLLFSGSTRVFIRETKLIGIYDAQKRAFTPAPGQDVRVREVVGKSRDSLFNVIFFPAISRPADTSATLPTEHPYSDPIGIDKHTNILVE